MLCLREKKQVHSCSRVLAYGSKRERIGLAAVNFRNRRWPFELQNARERERRDSSQPWTNRNKIRGDWLTRRGNLEKYTIKMRTCGFHLCSWLLVCSIHSTPSMHVLIEMMVLLRKCSSAEELFLEETVWGIVLNQLIICLTVDELEECTFRFR